MCTYDSERSIESSIKEDLNNQSSNMFEQKRTILINIHLFVYPLINIHDMR